VHLLSSGEPVIDPEGSFYLQMAAAVGAADERTWGRERLETENDDMNILGWLKCL
jgi:hypothetical protein